MPDRNEYHVPPEERIGEILMKVVQYQKSLSDDRAVELDELKREGVLGSDDIEFLKANSVTYKPHRRSAYHALDMFHMPTPDGGCVFIGPKGPPLIKRRARLKDFGPILETFLRLPRPRDELLLHIQFSKHDGMAVSPEGIHFTLQTAGWRERLPAIRSVAAEFGLQPYQDEEVQCSWSLSFRTPEDSSRISAATVALLSRGCGFADDEKINYSAGALDEAR